MLHHIVRHVAKKMSFRGCEWRPDLAANDEYRANVNALRSPQWHSCVIPEVGWPRHEIQTIEPGVFPEIKNLKVCWPAGLWR